ncbi:hypothetical protein J6590_074290 [Homalodisca vitripennis]|nr:hypothetical protein J6590_074290 [Homalodisca vitripennis]
MRQDDSGRQLQILFAASHIKVQLQAPSEPEESENVPGNENKLRELNHVLLRNNDRPTPDPVMAESCKTSPQEQDGEIVHQLLDRPINNSMVCIEDCELESDIDTKVQDNNSVFRQLHYNVLTPDLVAPELETNVQEKQVGHEVTLVLNFLPSESTNFSEDTRIRSMNNQQNASEC